MRNGFISYNDLIYIGCSFSQSAKSGIYAKLWQKVQSTPGALIEPSVNVTALLMSGDYARVGDKIYMDSVVQTVLGCELYVLPETFMPSGYAIALPKGSPYTELFSET